MRAHTHTHTLKDRQRETYSRMTNRHPCKGYVKEMQRAHIGNVKVLSIRHWTPGTAFIQVSPAIPASALPACATRGDYIMLTGLGDDGYSQRRFAMLLTAKTTAANINPNCLAECAEGWWGAIVKCNEMTIH